MKQFYVYITTNVVTGKQYVGDHKRNPSMKGPYLGSGGLLTFNVGLYGRDMFCNVILEEFDTRVEARKAQAKYIQKYETYYPKGLNSTMNGSGGERCLHKSWVAVLKRQQSEYIVKRNYLPSPALLSCMKEHYINRITKMLNED
jgi:hypothetical protein